MSRKHLYELQADSETDHGGLEGLTDDDHPQYMHTSLGREITASHTFEAEVPFLIGEDGTNYLIAGLNADQLDGNEATAFAAAIHTHTKSDVSDLEAITATPAAGSIPLSDGSNKIDNGWLNTGSGNGIDADTVDGLHLKGDIIHPFLLMGA